MTVVIMVTKYNGSVKKQLLKKDNVLIIIIWIYCIVIQKQKQKNRRKYNFRIVPKEVLIKITEEIYVPGCNF